MISYIPKEYLFIFMISYIPKVYSKYHIFPKYIYAFIYSQSIFMITYIPKVYIDDFIYSQSIFMIPYIPEVYSKLHISQNILMILYIPKLCLWFHIFPKYVYDYIYSQSIYWWFHIFPKYINDYIYFQSYSHEVFYSYKLLIQRKFVFTYSQTIFMIPYIPIVCLWFHIFPKYKLMISYISKV